jgi:RNA 3'-terminal phosphate cyclase (ATP)
MLTIDGSLGEGGGQVLRTSLALAMATGRAIRIERIRAGRPKPGLMRQHLVAVRAAARLSDARVDGDQLHSQQLTFAPRAVQAGEYHFEIGSAGSTTLVLHTLLPPLLTAAGPSRLVVEGGTHNPLAPPFEQFAWSFLPLLERMGPRATARLERPGFYPAGGGRIVVDIEPAATLAPLEIVERGAIRRCWAQSLVARLPRHVADRELAVAGRRLALAASDLKVVECRDAAGPGNVLMIAVESERLTTVFTAFGSKGVPAESVAEDAVRQAQRYLDSDVPVDEHLADQLLVPMALSGGGVFHTSAPSGHTRTQIDLIPRFLDVSITAHPRASPPAAAEPTAAEPTAAEPTAAEPTAAEPTASEPTAGSDNRTVAIFFGLTAANGSRIHAAIDVPES